MRVLVCGGRDYTDWSYVYDTLDGLHKKIGVSCIIHGGARGADSLAQGWAVSKDLPTDIYSVSSADWDKYGKSAGVRRNEIMLTSSNPHIVVAFPGGRGTAHMVSLAKNSGCTVLQFPQDEDKFWN